MRPISRWRHMMASHVTVAALTGTRDAYGKPTYGAGVVYRAHLSRKRRLVRNLFGEQVDSGQAIYLDASAAIEPTAQVTLSTGDVGSTEAYAINPKIVAVERRFDQTGPHHIVLYCDYYAV